MTETRTYNSLGQLISQVVPNYLNMTYNYSATQNNGRITSSADGMTGENTTYTYDALNRLTAASNSLWNQTYTYDGFGNLLTKSLANGSPNPSPAMSVSYNADNQQVGSGYDSNGNLTYANGTWYWYSVENRLAEEANQIYQTSYIYAYDPWGKRVMSSNEQGNYIYTFYGITGQPLATLNCNISDYPAYPSCWIAGQNVYYGKKLIVSGGVPVVTDRLGSVRADTQGEQFAYYPFGEERTGTPDGRPKFGTYFRDMIGQDYADQRYYGSGTGRFLTVDPGGIKTANPSSPLSWNRYAYVQADPVNFLDPGGTDLVVAGTVCIGYEMIYCTIGYTSSGPATPENLDTAPEGGGGGKVPYYISHPCDKNDSTNAEIFDFIAAEQTQAQTVAAQTGLSADFILAWASYESGWGLSAAATKDNDFFGLTVLGKNPIHWTGSDDYSTCSVPGYDCFSSQPAGLAASAISALTSFGNKYLTAALTAQTSGGSATDIAQAIVTAGFNSEYGPGVYAGIVAPRVQMIQIREACQ